jgi:hypothetical protein
VADCNQHHAVDITNAEAEVHVARISKYETMLWVQRLYAAGIRDYYHNLLPQELKHLGYHKHACAVGYITPTGETMRGCLMEWHIRDDIMKFKNANMK